MYFATVIMGFFLIYWQDAIVRWFSEKGHFVFEKIVPSRFDNWSNPHLIVLFLFLNSSLKNIISSWSHLISLSNESIDSETLVFGCNISILNEFISEKNDSVVLSKLLINCIFNESNFSFTLILGVAIFNGVTVSLWAVYNHQYCCPQGFLSPYTKDCCCLRNSE